MPSQQRRPSVSPTPSTETSTAPALSGESNAAAQTGLGGAPTLQTDLEFLSELLGVDVTGVEVRMDAAEGGGGPQTEGWTDGAVVHLDGAAYRPGTPEGRALLAHELCHVLQNGGQGSGTELTGADTGAALGMLGAARDVLQTCVAAIEAGEVDAADLSGSPDEALARLQTALSELARLDDPTSARDAADVSFLLLEAADHGDAAAAGELTKKFGTLDSGRDDPLEREAHAVASQVKSGGTAEVRRAGSTPGVQRMAQAVAAAPLLAGGPPGWLAYAVIVVGGAIVVGAGVQQMSRSRSESRAPAVPRTDARTREDRDLGAMRFQVQWGSNQGGPTFSANVLATSEMGVTTAAAVAGMQQAHAQVAPNKAKSAASEGVAQAIGWIQSRAPTGIAVGGYSKSFYFRYKGYSDARADVENIKGHNLRT